MLKLILWLGLGYGALIGLLALMQSSMIFPRALTGPAPPLPENAQVLTTATAGGDQLQGVLLPGRDADAPLLLGFGGNAWNAVSVALFLHQIAPDHPVAAFHYRGYAPSTGRPSARAIQADAVLIHDYLHSSHDIRSVVAVGFSIGAGPASYLAARRGLRGVVLVTPFDSLLRVAQDSFPFAPVRWLFRHPMTPLDDLTGAHTPVALVMAARDEVIPPARARALQDGLTAAGAPPVHVATLNAGHNDIYMQPGFPDDFRAALSAVLQSGTD